MRPSTCAAAGLVGTLLLAGCSSLPGDFYANEVDLARAQTVWQDPWVAPSRLTVPEAGYGSNGLVKRVAGVRSTSYVGMDAATAAAQEVAAAEQQDWSLVGATCADHDVTAVLTRGGPDPDDAAVAEVEAETHHRFVDVVVSAEVPHHLDDEWPDLGPVVAVADTCLAGGSDHPAPELPDGEPRGAADDDVDSPSWPDDRPSADDRARLVALQADSWFASLDVSVSESDSSGGDRQRYPPSAHGNLSPGPRRPVAALDAVLASMTGWQLTYAACAPAVGGVATLRLDTDDGPVVARLEASFGDAGRVSWTVTLPIVGGPDQGWVGQVAALGSPPCLTGTTMPRRPVAAGTPVGLIDELQPLQE